MNPILRLRLWLVEYIMSGALAIPGGGSIPLTPTVEPSPLDRFIAWMGGLSREAAAGALNYLSGLEDSFGKPTELYIALCTVVPTSSSKGSTITEATGATGYARIQANGKLAKAVEGATSSIKNNAELVGSAITAGSATVIGWAALNSKVLAEGKVFSWGSCTSTVISSTQQPAKIATEAFATEIT